MLVRVLCDLTGPTQTVTHALFRYGVVERLMRCAERQGVGVLAWGFHGTHLRLVLEGDHEAVANTVRGVKVGTHRAMAYYGVDLRPAPAIRWPVEPSYLTDAVVWAHRAPVDAGAAGPLSSPWSSHRDLLQFRGALGFDVRALDGRVDPRVVHARCGGEPLPDGWPPSPGEREPLPLLLRVAGGVLGVLPADRRCFRLFVHLAKSRGWPTRDLADALMVTRRRIRQLASAPEPQLELALATLGDARLQCVP